VSTVEKSGKVSEISELCVRYSPVLAGCLKALQQSQFDTLLDPSRILAVIELVRLAAKQSDGEVIEMGVYRGGSAAAIAWMLRRSGLERTVHLCDTFGGMPASMGFDTHEEFDFADTSVATVSGALAHFLPGFPFQFHPGLFSETLPGMRADHFCFAHIDADLYQSVREACEYAYPRMARGGIMLFDDYAAPSCPGAMKAVDDFFRDKVEKPTPVSGCAYGVRVGSAQVAFPRLISSASLTRSFVSASYKAPARVARREFAKAVTTVISPRATKILSSPFLHQRSTGEGCETAALEAKKILVVRQDSIGDLVLTSSFLRELRRSNPKAWITLVVDSRMLNLVELCGHVNEVIGADLPFCGANVNLGRVLKAFRFSRERLRSRPFDLALLPRWDCDLYHSAYLAYFSGAAKRVGYSEHVLSSKSDTNRGFDHLLTHAVQDQAPKHEVERNMDLLKRVGGTVRDTQLELWLSNEDREVIDRTLRLNEISSNDAIVALAVGAANRRRKWPLGRFIEIGRHLQRKYGIRIAVVGGAEDRQLGLRVKDSIPGAACFAGDLSLRQTGALLERTLLVVANDSGPMHIGAAAGCSVLEISCHPKNGDPNHENSPRRFGPWTEDRAVLQPELPTAPCRSGCRENHAHCILGVTADEAKTAAEALLRPRLNRNTVDPSAEMLLSRAREATALSE
jgi:ADP-heptose:LPS heptosyltransferase